MKGILVGIILILCFKKLVKAAKGTDENESCQPEGFECASNDDCCSEFCYKDTEKLGVCKQACVTTASDVASMTDDPKVPYKMFPWHVTFYEKVVNLKLLCYGSLISHTVVMSAASCFIAEGVKSGRIYKRKASGLSVILGELNYPYENMTEEARLGTAEVKSIDFRPELESLINESIALPPQSETFKSYETDDIAMITLTKEMTYSKTIRPVCIDIRPHNFEESTLHKIVGKTVRRKNDTERDNPLTLTDMKFITIRECAQKRVPENRGFLNTNALCAQDYTFDNRLGGGLIVEDPIAKTYYLRGVTVDHKVVGEPSIFRDLSPIREFIERYLDDCKRICRRTCGMSAANLPGPTGANEYSEFPWHAAIYHYNATTATYHFMCVGTLVSHNTVISAATCFVRTDRGPVAPLIGWFEDNSNYKIGKNSNFSNLIVLLGKYHQSLILPGEEAAAQSLAVESVEFPPGYIPVMLADIAFVKLRNAAKFSRFVQPVCTDVGPDNFEKSQLIKGAVGKSVRWKLTGQNQDYALNFEEMKYVPNEECKDVEDVNSTDWKTVQDIIDIGGKRWATKDLICAGNKSVIDVGLPTFSLHKNKYRRGLYACTVYRGRGLVFRDSKTKMHYLRGVAGIQRYICLASDFVPFFQLTSQRALVEKYVDDCRQHCRRNLCEPLVSEKLHITCLTSHGQLARCDKPLPSNSRAIFTCNSLSYMEIERSGYYEINCRYGIWDRPLVDDFCVPAYAECGRQVSNKIQAVVKNGKRTKYGEFPWHAGIYEFNCQLNSYEQVCGGTLITHNLVISAAHCFEQEIVSRKVQIKDLSTLKIGLGKYRRTLQAPQDVLAQIVDVEKIELAAEYLSHMAQYSYDIAFVTLKTQVEYTRAVRPVCIDVGPHSFENDQLVKGTIGKIVGWGLTDKEKSSEELVLAEMPFVTRDECRSNISSGLFGYVRDDKICAGDPKSNVTVCTGDSGGGFVFQDPKTKKYYLRGIVSLGPKGCKGPDFALFTRLSSYKDLLEKYLRLP